MFFRSRINAWAFSGTTDGGVLQPIRHPGLAPGTTQTGRDLKTTTAGCFQDPEYRWGDFGTTDGGVLQPIRHPGLAPGTNKKAKISKQPRWTPQKVSNPIPNNEL